MSGSTVHIRYHRPPDRLEIFEQEVVHRTAGWTVTYLPRASVKRPVTAGERVILEPDSPIVWFTFPGKWYDIGRFHLANGTFTGYYANLLTPVVMEDERWETTDLFLDVWQPAVGEAILLDEDELAEAVARGWVNDATAARAREQAGALLEGASNGEWPPAPVREWTLDRARARLGYSLGSRTEAETRRLRST